MLKSGWIQKPFSKHRLFVAGIFLFAVIAHVPYIAPGGPSACYPNPLFMVYDEGTVLYDSFRITCGEVMYRDFFQFQGPVFYYVYAGLFAVTGPSIGTGRALNLLVTAFTATIIALLIGQILGPIAGAGAAIVHIFLLVPIYPYAYPHWLAETFAFAGIYLLVGSGGRPGRELGGGAFLGLSCATIQSLGLPILATSMATLAVPGIVKRNWRETYVRPLRVFGGALLSISPFIIHLGAVGGLNQVWYGMAEWVLKHYSEGQKDAAVQGYGAYLNLFLIAHRKIGLPWRSLAMAGLQFANLLPFFSICGAIVVIVKTIITRWQRSLDYGYLMIGTTAIAATTPLLLGITRVDIVHIAFVGSFGLCGAAIALKQLITWKPYFRLPVAIVWAFVGILVIANFSAKTVMTYRPSREMKGWREQILKLGMARWIDNNVGPEERIVTAYGGLQYLYIRRCAVGFTFLPQGTPRYYSDEQWRKLGRQILKALPPVIEVTQEQWLQVTERTPELMKHYHLYKFFYNRLDRYLLLREGFNPGK